MGGESWLLATVNTKQGYVALGMNGSFWAVGYHQCCHTSCPNRAVPSLGFGLSKTSVALAMGAESEAVV